MGTDYVAETIIKSAFTEIVGDVIRKLQNDYLLQIKNL